MILLLFFFSCLVASIYTKAASIKTEDLSFSSSSSLGCGLVAQKCVLWLWGSSCNGKTTNKQHGLDYIFFSMNWWTLQCKEWAWEEWWISIIVPRVYKWKIMPAAGKRHLNWNILADELDVQNGIETTSLLLQCVFFQAHKSKPSWNEESDFVVAELIDAGLRPAMGEPIKVIVIVNELTMSQSIVAQWHPTLWNSSNTKTE